MIQLKNPNCNETQTKIVTILKNSNSDNSISEKNIKQSFGKNNLTPWQPIRCTLSSLLQSCNLAMFSSCISAIIRTSRAISVSRMRDFLVLIWFGPWNVHLFAGMLLAVWNALRSTVCQCGGIVHNRVNQKKQDQGAQCRSPGFLFLFKFRFLRHF